MSRRRSRAARCRVLATPPAVVRDSETRCRNRPLRSMRQSYHLTAATRVYGLTTESFPAGIDEKVLHKSAAARHSARFPRRDSSHQHQPEPELIARLRQLMLHARLRTLDLQSTLRHRLQGLLARLSPAHAASRT